MLSKIWYNIFMSCFWFLHLSLKLRFFAYVLLSVPFAHLLWKSKCLLMPKNLSYRNVLHLFGMLSPRQFQQCPLCWGYNPKKHQQPPKSTTILKVLFNNNRWRWCSHKSLYIWYFNVVDFKKYSCKHKIHCHSLLEINVFILKFVFSSVARVI